MEKRLHLYVSKKHPALWLALLCLLASAAARISVFSLWGTFGLWRHIIWPVAATVLFGLLAVLGGQERLYRTAIPFWMLGGCTAWQLHSLFGGTPFIYAMICLCILFFCIGYTSVITDGNVFTRCPDCGCEIGVDLNDVIDDGQLDLHSLRVCCPKCSRIRWKAAHKGCERSTCHAHQ